jgi:hypothetical protein
LATAVWCPQTCTGAAFRLLATSGRNRRRRRRCPVVRTRSLADPTIARTMAAAGGSAPWQVTRRLRGDGASAHRRSVKTALVITTAVMPSRWRRLSAYPIRPSGSSASRDSLTAGPPVARRSGTAPPGGRAAHGANLRGPRHQPVRLSHRRARMGAGPPRQLARRLAAPGVDGRGDLGPVATTQAGSVRTVAAEHAVPDDVFSETMRATRTTTAAVPTGDS